MSSKYQFEYVTYLVCPDHGTGSVRFRGKELIAGVTNVSWAGSELRAATTKGPKRVVFGEDGTVAVEDVVPDSAKPMSRDELSAVAQQVHHYFEATESGPDTAAYPGPR